jgi:uncharacterized protein YxjI
MSSLQSKQASKAAEILLLSTLALFPSAGCSPSNSNRNDQGGTGAEVVKRELSNSMKMKEIYFAYGTDLTISDSDGKIGTVQQRTLNLTPCFEYRDNTGAVLAYTSQSMLSFGTHIDIFDGAGNKIGALQDKVFSNLFSISRVFSLQDAAGNQIGTSEKFGFFATSVTIYDQERKVLAAIHRPAFDLGLADWTIDTPGNVDKRLVVFIPAYKTHSDNQRASK